MRFELLRGGVKNGTGKFCFVGFNYDSLLVVLCVRSGSLAPALSLMFNSGGTDTGSIFN